MCCNVSLVTYVCPDRVTKHVCERLCVPGIKQVRQTRRRQLRLVLFVGFSYTTY